MVAEACQESGTIYTGSIYYGYGDISHKNLSSGPYVSLCDITPPWGGTLTDELLTEDVPEVYSSGSERYVITMHDAFIGAETKSAEFTECWYTEDGNRYVKTTGSDSALGNNWPNAWKTAGYGFQNIPSGKDLYVEEGLYGGETLSNLDPPQTMKIYIQPSGHIEAACNAWVNDKDSFTFGTLSSSGNNSFFGYSCTYLDPSHTVPFTGKIVAFGFYKLPSIYTNGDTPAKIVIYRDDGTNYVYIGSSDIHTVYSGLYSYLLTTPIDVQSGDILALWQNWDGSDKKCSFGYDTSSNEIKYKNGLYEYDTLKSAWGDTGFNNLRVYAWGFKSA